MTRRNFLKHTLGGGALLSLAAPVAAQTTQTLRLLTTDAVAAKALTDRISAATGDALQVETTVVPINEATTMLARVSDGDADMCLTGLDSFLSRNLAFGLFASMPFGMAAGELEGWVHASDGRDMLAMLGDEHGVAFHFAGDTGTKQMWSKAPLVDLATLQQSVVGSSKLGILNLQQIGVQNVVDLDDPTTDLAALDVIDGLSVAEIVEKGLADTFIHMTQTNPNTPSSLLTLTIGTAAFEGLSEGHRVVVARACSAALTDGRARSFHESATALSDAGAGFTANQMPDDIWQALRDGSQNVLQTIFEEGDTQATVVDAYVYFLTDIAGWSDIGEAAFYMGRKRLVSL